MTNQARIIAVTNQKGGVGKTTTSVNLAAALAYQKKKVLLIDADPQGNATTGIGLDRNELEHSLYDVLMNRLATSAAIQHCPEDDVDVLGANGDLTAAEVELVGAIARERRLAQALEPVRESYHYILIDCPPSLNLLTLNGLVAADAVLVPVQCEYYALEGLSALMQTIDDVQRSVNPALHIDGMLRTMYDGRSNLANDVSEQLSEHFGERVYRTVIPRNVRLAEAPSHGMPISRYDRTSRGALAYLALAGEIIRRDAKAKRLANGRQS
ncbi:MAG: ParA family protein [Gammaproteobacteria bacterium]|nr:ParA family protein [Gammaproteobacteria bacterium]